MGMTASLFQTALQLPIALQRLSWEICFYLISLIEHQSDVDYNVVQEMNGGMDEDVKTNVQSSAGICFGFGLYFWL